MASHHPRNTKEEYAFRPDGSLEKYIKETDFESPEDIEISEELAQEPKTAILYNPWLIASVSVAVPVIIGILTTV